MINLDKYSRIDLFQWLSQFCKTFRDKVDVLLEEGKQIMIEELKACEARANAQDEPTAESGAAKPAEAASENPAGGGSAPSPCSASGAARPEQGGENLSGENDNTRDEWSMSGQIRKAHRLIQSLQNRVTCLERQIQGLA